MNAFFLIAACVIGFFGFANTEFTNAVWYSTLHDVQYNHVYTDPKPRDCDFMTAPMGDKLCSYSYHVRLSNAAGYAVVTDGPWPQYGKNKDGKAITSYDGGKNWYFDTSDMKINSVSIYWTKA